MAWTKYEKAKVDLEHPIPPFIGKDRQSSYSTKNWTCTLIRNDEGIKTGTLDVIPDISRGRRHMHGTHVKGHAQPKRRCESKWKGVTRPLQNTHLFQNILEAEGIYGQMKRHRHDPIPWWPSKPPHSVTLEKSVTKHIEQGTENIGESKHIMNSSLLHLKRCTDLGNYFEWITRLRVLNQPSLDPTWLTPPILKKFVVLVSYCSDLCFVIRRHVASFYMIVPTLSYNIGEAC